MHPRLEDLLDLRDGRGDAATADHVRACGACAAEVERLRAVAEALRALPRTPPPHDRWPSIRAKLEAERRSRRAAAWGGAALALAASVLILVLLPALRPEAPPPEAGPAPEIADLVRESQRLEQILRSLRPEGRVMDVADASAAADLEDGIALIDSRLTRPLARPMRPQEAAVLWRDRVDLMTELVHVHSGSPSYVGL